MTPRLALAAAAALWVGATAVAFLLPAREADERVAISAAPRPIWTETQWPFPRDPWGAGRAFRCAAADCGAAVTLYLRAKIGFCNCVTGIADDDDLDRMGDVALLDGAASPRGHGRPVTIGWMTGRARAYALVDRTALSVAFNDRCDMAVATIVLPHDRVAALEPRVLDFLNSAAVLDWAKLAFGI
jgi:hypothetical protein